MHSDPYSPESDQVIRIIPKKNRLVLFETNEISWHGFMPVSHLVPPGITRKSFAIYMYTKNRPAEEIKPRHGTFYVPRLPLEILKEDSLVDANSLKILKNARSHILRLIRGVYDSEIHNSQFTADREYEISLLKSEIEELRSKADCEFLLTSWGPKQSMLGEIPNVQPDGNMGIWIKCRCTTTLKKWKLSFNGHLVDLTVENAELYTASVSPLLLNTAGVKDIYLIDTAVQKTIPIGSFLVMDKI